MILTEQEIRKLQTQHPTENNPMPFARAIESAVLDKLKAQEPVCEVNTYHLKGGDPWCNEVLLYSGNSPYDRPENRTKLYAHPLPPDDVVRDVGCYEFKPFVQSWMKTANECDAAIDAAMEKMK